MKNFLMAAAVLGALTAGAGAASANTGDRFGEARYERSAPDWRDRAWSERYDRRWDFGRRLDWIEARIDHGFDRGLLTRGEARSLSRDLRRIADLRRAYERDGVSRSEALDLDTRLDRLSDRVRFERRDRDRRFDDRSHGGWRDWR